MSASSMSIAIGFARTPGIFYCDFDQRLIAANFLGANLALEFAMLLHGFARRIVNNSISNCWYTRYCAFSPYPVTHVNLLEGGKFIRAFQLP